jgi:hypothetical protein
MDSHVEEMIEGNLEDAFKKITITHLPRKNQIIKNIKDLEDESSIMNMISIKIVGHDGRPVATVGAIEDDLDGHIVMNMMQDIEISNIFLRQSIVGLVKKFNLTCDQLVEYVCHSPLFPEDRKPMLEYGLSAYLHGQAIHSIHLLIPQIEAAVRMLVQNSGGTVLQAKANSMGGYDFRAFGSLLCDETIIKIFGGEDVSLYFRVLFTDRRGINLRNNVCHGISLPETLDISMADRVVHALLLIALLRNADEENGSK